MGMTNHSNRTQNSQNIGAVAATKEIGLIQAQKKLLVHEVSIVDIAAQAASGANYLSHKLAKNGVDLTDPVEVDTQDGLAVREAITLIPASEIVLEKGDFLSLIITVTGTGAITNGSVHSDIEVVGN